MSFTVDDGQRGELYLDVDPLDPRRPLHAQLEQALRLAIQTRRLPPGSPLPASRKLAQRLGCSRWVVVQSYEQLTAEGYLTSRTGSGTRVDDMPAPEAEAPVSFPDPSPVRIPSTRR
ncbi:winged helix-turn-helix domain-containing protein [Streptomyces sp. NBC_01288]|uniref:winged helix-turn-helix domain-containing protein n=1 Tax=Streptomyces sp. NBC_01288 TaxID=2903814 RepID=UPI002E148405|nr:winged helix-turn-helix domain-containing protein [Streptomyces sp. NBC_01288]